MNSIKNAIAVMIPLLLIFGACEKQEVEPVSSEDYFPLSDDLGWSYQRWLDNGPAHNGIWDTLTLRVGGNVAVEGKSYREIIGSDGNSKLVRVEGSKYYGRHHELYGDYSHEYIFLDTEKTVGESWSYIKDNGLTKTEYVILSTNATHTIFGVVYKDVIEVQVNYYQQYTPGVFDLWVTAVHYYAKDAGEIYHYYPYPVSNFYGNISSFLFNGHAR